MEDNKRHKELDDRFSNLPLPDEDRAWQDMKKRLEKDDEDRFIVLPPFLQGCVGWTLLLALLLGGTFWFYFHDGGEAKESKEEAREVRQTPGSAARPDSARTVNNPTPEAHKGASRHIPAAMGDTTASKEKYVHRAGRSEIDQAALKTGRRGISSRELTRKSPVVSKARTMQKAVGEDVYPRREALANNKTPKVAEDTTSGGENHFPADSAATKVDTTTRQQPPAVADSVQNTPPKKQDRRKEYRLAAGIALQQQVPFDGQEWTPYNYRGRKGSLADYVPSVYLRLYRGQKWFVQSEFKYGAPQYTREFVYSKEVKTDTFGIRSSTSYRLKKTYYHQLPFSFNVYVKPSWSVGTGIVYNRFYGAVSDREVRMGTSASPDTVVSKELVLDKNESLFRSTNLQWLLETQYRVNRWSFGGRFAQGLQPYIEYVDEQGKNKKERNHSLQFFIRYELWTSKKK